MIGGKKLKAKKDQFGRSMVEMLGVLAIIGVLSVGAIAGYSSAMTKHKLNKQAEQLSWLLNILYQYKSQWVFNEHVHLAPYYKKMGLIPEEMIKDDSAYIYDAFGFKLELRTNDVYDNICRAVILRYQSRNEKVSFEMCHNLFTTAVAFHEQLQFFSTYSIDHGWGMMYWGDKYCVRGQPCLKDIDVDKIYETCQTINNGLTFEPYFSFKIQD